VGISSMAAAIVGALAILDGRTPESRRAFVLGAAPLGLNPLALSL